MGEWDIHCWVNLFINYEAEIQPLLHLIMTTLQVPHWYQKEGVVIGQGIHSISGEVHGPEEL